ncbi:hypothetical protein HKBW3C_01023 [Candidatus Hakubella thermalkaliphila]|nr:hypothetical protein HKBW3C_01023 [Candidatus Hakubella thermalkaliphila]
MYSRTKRFFDRLSAARTSLRCSIGANFPIPSPSVFSFGFEYAQEHAPGSIRDTFRKVSMANHPFNIEVFCKKPIISLNKRAGHFMTKIKSLISNSFMGFGHKKAGLLSAIRPFLSTRQSSLSFGQLSFRAPEVFRSLYLLSIAGGKKGLQSHINTYFLPGFGQKFRFSFDHKRNIPPVVSTGNGKSLYFTLHRPVPFNFR